MLKGSVDMKFLILTVTVGHGHNQAAKSVSEYIKSQGHSVLVLDTLEYILHLSYIYISIDI